MNTWMLFIHQISQDAPNLRVKVWRDLKKHGAVLFKNAVYVLPYNKQHEEIMQWLCKQIKDSGSDASLFITESLDKEQDEEIIKRFHEICDKEYLTLITACDDMLKKAEQIEGTEGISANILDDFRKRLNEIIKNTEDISRIDFFHAPQKERVSQKIQLIRRRFEGWAKSLNKSPKREGSAMPRAYRIKDFMGKKWVTRKDIYIDRIASAWLIQRFIDPKAKFVFLAKSTDRISNDTIPFDMYGAEFTHHGDACTFETFIQAFGLRDLALQPIAEIVHDADLNDTKYNRKESEGIVRIISGLSQKLKNDKILLEKGLEMFDALYHYYSSK